MQKKINIEQLQESVGLLDTNDGIVTQAIVNTELEALLNPFLEAVDFQLYFNYANRIVIGKYTKNGTPNTSLLKKSIYYALKGNEYTLRTIIGTTELEYDPINNYEIHETITSENTGNDTMNFGKTSQVTSTSISSFAVETKDEWGEDKLIKDIGIGEKSNTQTTVHGTIQTTMEHNTTQTTGAQQNITTDEIAYGNTSETQNKTLTMQRGARTTTSSEENKVSAYNVDSYQPSSDKSGSQNQATYTDTDTENNTITKDSHTDTKNISENLGERADKTTGTDTETITEYTDTITNTEKPYEHTDTETRNAKTDTHTRTENPHNRTSEISSKERTDTKDTKSTENRSRDLKGRYGFTTTQDLIKAEREIAELNITERIIAIVIHQICEGVLYTW